jgi:pentatricopeptide repeat protein
MIQYKKPVLNVYFNSVMDAYRKQGKKEKVLEFYRLMQNIGLFVKEDTYNILISLYGSEDFDHLQVILDTMKRNKTLVSKNGISIIMKTYYLNKKYDLVREWYGKLKERGMFPNEVALQTMMRTSMAQGLNLENCLLYYEMATTLKIVNRMLIQEFLLTHLICGTPLNEALSKFLEEMKKYKQPVQLKTIYIVLDYILSPSSFVKSSLHRVDYMPRDEVVPKRPGLAEFKELCKLVEIPTRLDAEITLAKQHLE